MDYHSVITIQKKKKEKIINNLKFKWINEKIEI